MEMDLSELQGRLSNMMEEIHSFFEKHGIDYFLYYGSLLGAVRHHNFIPWDDDLDIGMLREDFEKFLVLAPDLPHPYKLRYKGVSGTDQNYPYTFAKIEDISTVLIEKDIEHLGIKSGMYIDIFIFDKVPDNYFKRKIQRTVYSMLCLIRNLLLVNPQKKRSALKQIAVITAQKLFSIEEIVCKMINVASRYNYKRCKSRSTYIEKITPALDATKVMKGDLLKFGEYSFYGTKGNDYILRTIYGDYMQLPPEKERKSPHRYELEFQ